MNFHDDIPEELRYRYQTKENGESARPEIPREGIDLYHETTRREASADLPAAKPKHRFSLLAAWRNLWLP